MRGVNGRNCYDVTTGGLFIILWLLPICYVGFFDTYIPGVPVWQAEQYRIAGLFPNRAVEWSNYYLELQINGDKTWLTIDDRDFSSMQLFGYRTRLDRLIEESFFMNKGMELRKAIALFVKKRYEASSSQTRVTNFRIVKVVHSTAMEIAKFSGHWKKFPSLATGIHQVVVFETGQMDENNG